jgi:hypothetical protein
VRKGGQGPRDALVDGAFRRSLAGPIGAVRLPLETLPGLQRCTPGRRQGQQRPRKGGDGVDYWRAREVTRRGNRGGRYDF